MIEHNAMVEWVKDNIRLKISQSYGSDLVELKLQVREKKLNGINVDEHGWMIPDYEWVDISYEFLDIEKCNCS